MFNLLLILIISNSNAKEVLLDKIVTLVGNDIITLSDIQIKKEKLVNSNIYEKNSKEFTNKNILNTMLKEKLIKQYLSEKDYLPTEQDIQNSIDKIKKQYGFSQIEFEKKLKSDGIAYSVFREARENDIIFRKFFEMELKNKINITDKDLELAYKKQYKKDAYIYEYKIKHILVKNKSKAKSIAKIINKNNFNELVFKNTIDEGSKYSGGELGYLDNTYLIKELRLALKNMSIQDIKGPIKTNNGYEIIMLQDIKRSLSSDYKEKVNSLRYSIIEKESQVQLEKWIEKRKEVSYVKIFI